MDPLSPTQLQHLKDAAKPGGVKPITRTANRLRRLRFVEDRVVRPEGGLLEGRIFATPAGLDYLRAKER